MVPRGPTSQKEAPQLLFVDCQREERSVSSKNDASAEASVGCRIAIITIRPRPTS